MAMAGASHLCEWADCCFVSDDFDTFYEHVKAHTTNFLCETKANACQWRQCLSDSHEDEQELVRHVLFHAYHAKLKDLGLKAQKEAQLNACTLNLHARNLVPVFSEEFSCCWKNCNVTTSCPRNYYAHVNGHAESTVKGADYRISCEWKDCTFTSTKRSKLKEHCRTHTHEKSFSCPNCGGLFSNKTKFTDHLRRQNTMKSESYQCSHCSKHYPSERILRDHMRHHIKNVKCSFCEMSFASPSDLQHHVDFRHSDERPFCCELCDASFKTANDLRRHEETHDPTYSHHCQEEGCHYAAKALQSLRRHQKKWHENQVGRYACHVCPGVSYTRGANLSRHLTKNHGLHPSAGHRRFRYKQEIDGMYRLQTVRFEIELSQQQEAEHREENPTEDDPDTTNTGTPPAIEMVSLTQPIVSPSPTATEVLKRAFQEQPEADISSNAPTPCSQSFDVLLNTDSDIVPPSPRVTRQTRALLNRAFYEQPETADISSNTPTPQCPTDSEDLDVQETVSLVASLRNLGM